MESPARQISLVPAPDGRQSETALKIAHDMPAEYWEKLK